jgi:hypothetical protein
MFNFFFAVSARSAVRSFRIKSKKKEQHHDGQQDVADIQVDIAVLHPAQLYRKTRVPGNHQWPHVQFGHIMDLAVIMGRPGNVP